MQPVDRLPVGVEFLEVLSQVIGGFLTQADGVAIKGEAHGGSRGEGEIGGHTIMDTAKE